MYVCMHTCMYVCIHVCLMYVRMYVFMYACMHSLCIIYVYIHVCVCICMYVAQLVEELRYKSERRVFDSRWCDWNFILALAMALGLTQPLTEMSTRNISWD
jgi:hypothetical protein